MSAESPTPPSRRRGRRRACGRESGVRPRDRAGERRPKSFDCDPGRPAPLEAVDGGVCVDGVSPPASTRFEPRRCWRGRRWRSGGSPRSGSRASPRGSSESVSTTACRPRGRPPCFARRRPQVLHSFFGDRQLEHVREPALRLDDLVAADAREVDERAEHRVLQRRVLAPLRRHVDRRANNCRCLERRDEQFLLRAGGVREARRERLGAGERLGLVGGAELGEEVVHRRQRGRQRGVRIPPTTFRRVGIPTRRAPGPGAPTGGETRE